MKADKMILGKGLVCSMDSAKTGLNNNVIVIGGTGCGKTMSISEPLLLHSMEGSRVITVTKKSLISRYGKLLANRGYNVNTLDFANPEQGSVAFDPMAYIKEESDIAYVADAIVRDSKSHGSIDPYWDNSSASLLSALMGYIYMASKDSTLPLRSAYRREEHLFSCPEDTPVPINTQGTDGQAKNNGAPGATIRPKCTIKVVEHPRQYRPCLPMGSRPSFVTVMDLFRHLSFYSDNEGISTTLDWIYTRLQSEYPECLAATCWRSFRTVPYKTAGCIYSSLGVILDKFFTPAVCKAIEEKNCVDIERLATRKTVLFVYTSPVDYSAARYTSLFYGQVFKTLLDHAQKQPGGKLPVPVHILCDDFATGATIPEFAAMISIFRQAGISVTLLLQSESQLEGLYGKSDATTIINNCDSYIYMGGMDLQTCRSVSERLDLPLSDVLYMPLGQEVIFRRGSRPVATERYETLRDPIYKEVLDAERACGIEPIDAKEQE